MTTITSIFKGHFPSRGITTFKKFHEVCLVRKFSEIPSKLPPLTPMPRIMHPDWYRTPQADDDVRMIGDYPNVPLESYQLRDPYENYFDMQNRRRWGEPLPEDYEPLTMWSFDHETSYGKWWVLGGLGGFFGSMFILHQLLNRIPSPLTNYTAPRELPYVASYYPGSGTPTSFTQLTPTSPKTHNGYLGGGGGEKIVVLSN